MQKRSLWLVEWEDPSGISRWSDEKTMDKIEPIICQSVGWRVKAPKGHIQVAASRSSTGQCADSNLIPKGCVKSIRRIE